MVTLWCALVLGPYRPAADADIRNSRLWPIARRQGARLLTTAALLGLISGCYWTFGVQAATTAAPVGSSSGAVFQLLVGLSGLAGGAVGGLLTRAALPRLLMVMALTLGAACLLLTAGPGWFTLLSAALYGAAFISSIGLLVIWNTRVLSSAAATGVATSMLAMGAGLIAGPTLAGAVAEAWGVDAVFLGCIPLSAALAFLVRTDRRRGPCQPGGSPRSDRPEPAA
jgi:predicted MFS family arabinose efflux permease